MTVGRKGFGMQFSSRGDLVGDGVSTLASDGPTTNVTFIARAAP